MERQCKQRQGKARLDMETQASKKIKGKEIQSLVRKVKASQRMARQG
jgi:hypothetical protein